MAQIFQCDRCGDVDMRNSDADKHVGGLKAHGARDVCDRDEWEICKSCMSSFGDWIRVGRDRSRPER